MKNLNECEIGLVGGGCFFCRAWRGVKNVANDAVLNPGEKFLGVVHGVAVGTAEVVAKQMPNLILNQAAG